MDDLQPTKPEVIGKPLTLNKKKFVFNALKLVISGGLIYWLLRKNDLVEILTAVRSANIWLLLLAFSLHLVGFTISAYRWRLLLRNRGSDTSIRFLIESYIVGIFFNNFLPSTIGGDIYRAYDSYRLGQSRSGAVAVVVVDRFLGLLALMIFALLALLNANALTERIPLLEAWVLIGSLGLLMIIWIMFFTPRQLPTLLSKGKYPFSNRIQTVLEAFLGFRGQYTVLGKALGLSILLQANVVFHYYLIAQSLNLSLSFYSLLLIVPLATVITMLPISVNGIGVRENALAFFFAPFTVAQTDAVAFAWILYGMVVVQGLIGGILYSFRR